MAETRLPSLPSQHVFTPELQLVTACSWLPDGALAQGQAEQIAGLCRQGIDWDRFMALVDHHRTPVLAHLNLGRYGGDHVPEQVRARLKAVSDKTRLQALHHGAELARLCRMFEEQGIAALPLKGVLLSQLLYGDPGIRQAKDLDIMIKPADLDAASDLLVVSGYRTMLLSHRELTPRQRRHVRDNLHHLEFYHGSKRISLELHWNCSLWEPAQAAELWRHCRHTTWLGTEVSTLDEDALLLYLCDHGTSHLWFRLKWLGDVAMLMAAAPASDWSGLPALAEHLGLQRVLAQTALLVHWFYGVELPESILEVMRHSPPSPSLASRVVTTVQLGAATINRPLEGLRISWHVKRLKPAIPLAALLKNLMIAPGDLCSFPLPDKLFWLYAPLRPLFWILRHLRPTRSSL